MENKTKQSHRSDLPVKLHNHLVAVFTKRMKAKGLRKGTKTWYKAQELFFTAALAVYDILKDDNTWESLYVRHQLKYQSEICPIILIPANSKEYYTVWRGRKPGVYNNWPDAHAQVRRYPGSLYAKFDNRYDAERAFAMGYEKYISSKKDKSKGGRPLF